MTDIYETKDKQIAPFLFTAKDIDFLGIRVDQFMVYFQFSPKDKCIELVNLFICNKAPLVQAKELLDAVETYRELLPKNMPNIINCSVHN